MRGRVLGLLLVVALILAAVPANASGCDWICEYGVDTAECVPGPMGGRECEVNCVLDPWLGEFECDCDVEWCIWT